jgi:hypothetical protein
MRARSYLSVVLLLAAACGGEDDPALASFPADYAATYQELRGCRRSLDHDLVYIKVLVSPEAVDVYEDRAGEFPEGSVVLKEQYDRTDDACAGEPVGFTVMVRLAEGAAPEDLGWAWEKADADRHVLEGEDLARCVNCHVNCVPPDGYQGTCTAP